MKTRTVGDELFRADGQADRHDEANSCSLCSLNFTKELKNTSHDHHSVPRAAYPSRDQNVCGPNRGSKSDTDCDSATALQL